MLRSAIGSTSTATGRDAQQLIDCVRDDEGYAHFQATSGRFAATTGPILVLQDTTEFTLQRERPKGLGSPTRSAAARTNPAASGCTPACGLLMHSSLAIALEGLPPGLVAIKFWTRSKFMGTVALKKKINPTRVPIEEMESVRWLENMCQSIALFADPARCIHIGDRESAIYELLHGSGPRHPLPGEDLRRSTGGDGEHAMAAEWPR